MNDTRIGVFAGVLGFVGVAVTLLPKWLLSQGIDSGFPAWVPQFGSLGSTTLTYQYLHRLVTPLLILGLAVGFGYYVGTRVDLRSEYRRFLGIIAGGTGVSVTVAWVVYVVYGVMANPVDDGTIIILVSLFGAWLVEISLVTTAGVLAGVTLVTFGRDEDRRIPTADSDGQTTKGVSGTETSNR